jgi:hypothetical protein
MWLADMNDEALQYGEEFICAKIYADIFQPYHPRSVEYLGIASRFKTTMTTGPGCSNRLKKLLERGSWLDAVAADARDRERQPGETCVDFAVQKIYLFQCVAPNLEPGTAIAMVKRKLDRQDAELCRERVNIDNFISELLECDNRQTRAAARRQSQAARLSSRGHGQEPGNGPQAYAPHSSGLHDYGKARAELPQFQPPQPAASYRQSSGQSEQQTRTSDQSLHNSPRSPASSYHMPPASSKAVPPGTSYDGPPASSEARPEASSCDGPPASWKVVPPASSEARPEASSYDMPPRSSKAMPPAVRTATPTAAVPQSYVPQLQAPQTYVPQSHASQSYTPQSHTSPSAGSHEHEAPPQLRFDEHDGSDIDAYAALWFAAMDRWVLRDGEEIVCPQICATCFQSDDAVKTWYLGMPSVIRTLITTKPGCWNLFKAFLLMRFLIGDGPRLRQLAAEEVRVHRPGVPSATFAVWKIYYIQCADPHLAPGAAIAMVKRELGWEAAAFCRERENIDDFISELTEFDEQQLEQQDCPDIAINEPEHPDENIDDFISELTEFDEQQLEQQAQPRSCEQPEKLEQRGYSTDCRDDQQLEQRGYSIGRDYCGEQKSGQQEQPHDYEQPEKLKQRGCPIERDCRDEQKLEYPFECDHRGEHKLEQRVSTNDCETASGLSEQPARPPDQRLQDSPMPPASSKAATPEPSSAIPPALSAMSPASSKAVTPAWSKAATPEASSARPPEPSSAIPPRSSKAVRPDPSNARPPEPSSAMPPDPSNAMPPEPSNAMPPEPSNAMPPAASSAMPPASSAMPSASSKAVPPEPSKAMPPVSSETVYTDPRLSTVQASRRHARMYAGEAELHGTIGSRLYHPRYGEKPLCLNLHVSNDDVASEATKKKYDGELHAESFGTTNDRELQAESIGTTDDGELHAESVGTTNDGGLHAESFGTTNDAELNAQKHQEKTTTEEPERSDESVDNSISELIEFDEQKPEQQEYPDVVVDDSEHPMVLDENQAVATTSMTTVDTRKVVKSLRLDWQDLVRPASPRTSHGTTVGTEPAGTIGSHLYHPRTTNDRELHAESIGTANDGELHAEKHDERINMKNAGLFNAERRQKLTAGSKAIPPASSYAMPPASSKAMPPAEKAMPPASSKAMPPAEKAMPPASSYDMPPASSKAMPPASSYYRPPASSKAMPPASSYDMPPASSYYMPPASSKAMPPASSYAMPPAEKAMPSASSYDMPPASSYYMPPAPSEAMPPASSYYMPPASSKAMPPAARTATPPTAAAAELCQSLRQSLKLAIEEVLLEFKEEFLREFNNHAGYHHHPQCEEPTTRKYDRELHAEKQHDERTRMTNDGEFTAEKHDERSGLKNYGESNAENHMETTPMDELEQPAEPGQPAEIIRMKNDGEFNAEKHQRLTAGSKASGALNAQQLNKEAIRASTLWFASHRCYEDELRDGIG